MFFHFLFKMSAIPYQRNTTICFYPWLQNEAYIISPSTHMFLYCLYPWLYIFNVQTCRFDGADIFSITVHVSRIWKISPLFGQILITCLKCSRVSFLPSSYSEKMHWWRGCTLLCLKVIILWKWIYRFFKLLRNLARPPN